MCCGANPSKTSQPFHVLYLLLTRQRSSQSPNGEQPQNEGHPQDPVIYSICWADAFSAESLSSSGYILEHPFLGLSRLRSAHASLTSLGLSMRPMLYSPLGIANRDEGMSRIYYTYVLLTFVGALRGWNHKYANLDQSMSRVCFTYVFLTFRRSREFIDALNQGKHVHIFSIWFPYNLFRSSHGCFNKGKHVHMVHIWFAYIISWFQLAFAAVALSRARQSQLLLRQLAAGLPSTSHLVRSPSLL